MILSVKYTRLRLDPRLASVIGRLSTSKFPEEGQALLDRASRVLIDPPPAPQGAELDHALAPFNWFLEQGRGDGLVLTQAGYLAPAAVKNVAALLPTMADWIFPVTREVNVQPVLEFRHVVQRLGLLRKYRGTLLVTRLGAALHRDPERLWNHVTDRLIPAGEGFEVDATILILIHLASDPGKHVDAPAIATTLGQLGWAREGGFPVTQDDVHWRTNEIWSLIGNVGVHVGRRGARTVSPTAVRLVRDALVQGEFTEAAV